MGALAMNEDDYRWLYLPKGERTHALRPGGSYSVCRLWSWWEDWRGDGSHAEYEQARRMPQCRKCLNAIERGAR